MSSPLSLFPQYRKYVHGKGAIKARGESFSGLKIAIFLMCARVILGYVPGNEGRGKKGEGGKERGFCMTNYSVELERVIHAWNIIYP